MILCEQNNLKLCSAAAAAAKLLQSCPTLCDPIDSSQPGSPVPGILQARTLEWVAIAFSTNFALKLAKFYTSNNNKQKDAFWFPRHMFVLSNRFGFT